MLRDLVAGGLGLLLAFIPAAALAAPVAQAPAVGTTFNPGSWQADLNLMRHALTSDYANLEWLLTERELDLSALFDRASSALRGAQSDADARQLFDHVIARIDDGHVTLEWPRVERPRTAMSAPARAAAPAQPLGPADYCRERGYRESARRGIAEAMRGYSPLAKGDLLPTGIVDAGGERIGFLRIGQFDPHGSPSLCEEAVQALAVPLDKPCDEECGDEVLTFAYRRLTATLEQRLKDLHARGAKLLVVDLTGNGGGSEWTEAAARMMTARRLTSARTGFVRGAHWERLWQEQAERLTAFAAKAETRDRARLLGWAAEAAAAAGEARRRCPPTGDPACPWLGRAGYSSGLVGSVRPGEFAGKEWGAHVFNPRQHNYIEEAWSGPLAILVDDETHSAAEQFAALLQDHRAGIVVGGRTGGSGCGYSWGGTKVTLPNSGAVLRLPDCARFRADGSNEVRGVLPDVAIPWRFNDGRNLRARMLEGALPDVAARTRRLLANADRREQ